MLELQAKMQTKGISFHGYHGGGLDGVNSELFLKHLDFLLQDAPAEIKPVLTMLQNFKTVVQSSFSIDLSDTYIQDIDLFNASMTSLIEHFNTSLNINVTPTWKIHILVAHIKLLLQDWSGYLC